MEDINNNGDLGSKVEFENQWETPRNYYSQRKTSKIIELAIKYSGGIIKDEQQASYVVLVVSVLITVISLFFLFKGERAPNIPPPANYPQLQNR